jgi:NTE family protein
MKIALALSGGGFRATVFHLGVLARLAEENRLEDINFLSTVSGGSLCAGMVFNLNGLIWPESQDFLLKVLPEARRLMTTENLQRAVIFRQLLSLWSIFETRADDLSTLMQKKWNLTANLNDLPREPRWMINATCYESGKNWRFERFRMGDYLFGYSNDTIIPLSDAMAASAGFPGLIGPLILDTTRHKWFKYTQPAPPQGLLASPESHLQRKTEPITPSFRRVHLWDGGVYDNHGLEGLMDVARGWRDKVEFLIVSDGAGRSSPERYRRGVKALLRITTGIMMDQIRSLRARIVLERLINHGDENRGSFIRLGNSCTSVLTDAGRDSEIPALAPKYMDEIEVERAAAMPTMIRKLTGTEFERLFRHGFEVADYTLYAYNSDQFSILGYQNRTQV